MCACLVGCWRDWMSNCLCINWSAHVYTKVGQDVQLPTREPGQSKPGCNSQSQCIFTYAQRTRSASIAKPRCLAQMRLDVIRANRGETAASSKEATQTPCAGKLFRPCTWTCCELGRGVLPRLTLSRGAAMRANLIVRIEIEEWVRRTPRREASGSRGSQG